MELILPLTIAVFVGGVVYAYLYTRQRQTELQQRFKEWSEDIISYPIKGRDKLKPILYAIRPISVLNDLLPFAFIKRAISKQLITANLPITVNEFLALKELSAIVFVLSYFLIFTKWPGIELIGILLLVGFFFPDILLNDRIRKRKAEISRELPNVIDLLTLCVEAGMDFMLAVRRVVSDYKPCAVTEELAYVLRQIQMGRSRAEALKHFAWRVDMPEVSSFVRALIQGDRMGTPIGEILRVQAEEMRLYRIMKAEEAGMKAPIKMLLPLLFFIMPVILIVVAGPILLKFIRGGIFSGF